MRHQKSGRKYSRTSSHRTAMFRNLVTSLILHERIETTDAKAKELKRLADRTISWGTSVGDLTAKGRDKLDAEEKARVVHAMRMAGRLVVTTEALDRLFNTIAPRFRGRTGGYTPVLKTRVRHGDAAPREEARREEACREEGRRPEGREGQGQGDEGREGREVSSRHVRRLAPAID
jgi:large subunit ribosomal protein L17